MACFIIKDMTDKGFKVGTLHADNDSTTQSRLPSSITKQEMFQKGIYAPMVQNNSGLSSL